MSYLIDIRTNSRFAVNYEDNSLKPETELIILVTQPKYQLRNKSGKYYLEKEQDVRELRVVLSSSDIQNLIGQLQHAAVVSSQFDQMGVGINKIIEQCRKVDGEV